MGLFKDFKDDFSEAMGEMIPSGASDNSSEEKTANVNTITEKIDVDNELSKLDGLLEKVAKKADSDGEDEMAVVDTISEESVLNRTSYSSPVSASGSVTSTHTLQSPASDENAVITSGMTITGDLESTGSIVVEGRINGNVRCSGKLTVSGLLNGNCASAEFFADSARIEGEINANGTVKIGAGSVVIGNISASSAVIAGAVKGDIDVQGPVVVDTSAVVMGNVKSRSVQINNGAVIEGFCSQAYSDVDVSNAFV